MSHEFEAASQGKTIGDLGNEALWFIAHTVAAMLILAAVVLLIGFIAHPDPDQQGPKLLGTALAFLVPAIGGLFIARIQGNVVSRYVWISGLILFAIVCVWVIDLPTGPGLCERCGVLEKLSRTFFDINHGSGLMGGDGLLVGTWLPLSMIGYAIGAKFGLQS